MGQRHDRRGNAQPLSRDLCQTDGPRVREPHQAPRHGLLRRRLRGRPAVRRHLGRRHRRRRQAAGLDVESRRSPAIPTTPATWMSPTSKAFTSDSCKPGPSRTTGTIGISPGSWKTTQTAAFRQYGQLRYKLLPYLYSTAAEAALTGYPVMRAMSMVYPDDPAWDACLGQYMLGDFLLVSAFSKEVRLPEGDWIDFWSGKRTSGPATLPVRDHAHAGRRAAGQERRHHSHLAGLRSRREGLVARSRTARLSGGAQHLHAVRRRRRKPRLPQGRVCPDAPDLRNGRKDRHADHRRPGRQLCRHADNIIGVRLPKLREIAKEIAKGDWRNFLATSSNDYYEEVMINGLVIAYAKCDVDEKLNYIESFVPKIDNWAICDSFCNSLKFVNKNKEKVWEFIQPYLKSNKEFEIRFAVVIILNYYITEDYIDLILETLDEVKHEGYYVKMAVAWAISLCFVKFEEKTMNYLKNNKLDDFTYNKSLQKICESLRVDKDTKAIIKSMKR